MPLFFQNCSPGFKINESLNSSSLSSTAPVCNNGETQSGYLFGSVLYPMTCGSTQTKTCINGQWNMNTVLSPSCKQQCVHPDTQQAVDENSTYVTYSIASAPTQAQCDAARITGVCQSATGLFAPAAGAYKSCLVQGQVCAYPTGTGIAVPTGHDVNDTVTGYATSTATYPTLCGAIQTRSCQANGQWTGTVPLYTSCMQKCVHPDNGQPVDANMNYVFYTIASGSQAQCNAARVSSVCTASTGQFTPAVATTRYSTCAVILPVAINSFTSSSSTITTGQTVTLSWSVSNATSVILNPGMISVTGQTSTTVTPGATTTYTLVASNSVGSVSAPITITVNGPLLGQALYTSACASCHGAFAVSTLQGRTITSAIISTAINSKISSMKPLDGTLSTAQIDSLAALFPTTTDPGSQATSSFVCPSTEAEKNNSAALLRLTGPELKNTYAALLPATIWNGLSSYYYMLPPDNFEGDINKFISIYTEDFANQISRFNEQVANQITLSNANVSAFFGSCATLTSFTKTCFDTFLTAKGPQIFRSALAADDNASLWTIVTQTTVVPTQLKILVQLLFNDPRFIYHIELGEGAADANGLIALTSYEVANRISYGMTSSPPDATLWADAVQNRLKTMAIVNTHIDRLAATSAYKNRITGLLKFYVGTEKANPAPTLADFMNGVNGTDLNLAATDEFNDFINYIVFTQQGTLRDLFTSRATFPRTPAMATVMGTTVWASGAALSAPNHAGILTKPYLHMVDDPNLKLVQRGKKIRINMLCSDVPQPSAADLAARPLLTESDLINLNRRAYIDKATLVASNCIACHSRMNQLGFATEHYDSIGRFITTEKIYNNSSVKVAEHTVISTSTPAITENDTRTFANVNDFQVALSQSNTLQQCFSRKAFQYLQRKADDLTKDSCRLNKLDTALKTNLPLANFFLENFKQQSILYKRSQ